MMWGLWVGCYCGKVSDGGSQNTKKREAFKLKFILRSLKLISPGAGSPYGSLLLVYLRNTDRVAMQQHAALECHYPWYHISVYCNESAIIIGENIVSDMKEFGTSHW